MYIPVNCNKKDYDYLMNCNKLSAKVWNLCIELNNKNKLENNQWINQSELQKQTKGCVNLHSKNIQFVLHKYLHARDSAYIKIKNKIEGAELPHRNKKYYNTGWDYQSIKVDYKNSIIKLSKPKDINNKIQKPIICHAKTIPKNIVEIELIYKNRLYLAIKSKENIEYLQIKSNNSASIDLGEIHSITSIDNNSNAIIITGRKLRSIKQLRNKNQGKLYSRKAKCKKNSKQYKRYMKALNNLRIKNENKINDAVHKISKLYLDYCLENNISTVYYGDLDSCTRNTKERTGSFVGQKLNQWCYGQIMRQLENKLTRYEIKLIKISEAYSSQTCPMCGNRYHPKGRNYICSNCGYIQHRDLVGAINILNFNTNYNISKYNTFKYLQIA